MKIRLDLDAIRAAHPLTSVAGAVVKLTRAGADMKGCCPFHADRTPSFYVFDHGQRYHCFGCGVGGDVLDFVQRLHDVGLRQAADMITGGDLPVIEIRPIARQRESAVQRDTTAEAVTIWNAALAVEGTPAEQYLRRRGITMPLPDCLRFSRIRYGFKGPLHPALIAAVTDAAGGLIGIQRTYLSEKGSKADVEKAKLSLGRVRGGSIQLGPPSASMLVTEGLEDGLTLVQGLGRSVWVAAGTSMMPSMAFPKAVRAIVIGADGDGPGEVAAQKTAASFSAAGLAVRIMRPGAGFKDFNAELIGNRS